MSEVLQLDFVGDPANIYAYGNKKKTKAVVKEMYHMLVEQFGVTQSGPFVTLRFGKGDLMKQVTMVIIGVDDGVFEQEETSQ